MSDHTIEHVSDTALWVAAYRAIESERPDALFKDPLAAKLVGERGLRIAEHMRRGSVIHWAVVMRTCIIDELITTAIADGVDTILNLGAGLDTRPYRMELPSTVRWLEVDYAHLQEFKQRGLGAALPRCQLENVSLDLADLPARRALFARVNEQASRVLVLTEGVTPYLTNADVAALADDLRAQPKFQLWVLDYMTSTRPRRGFGFGHRRLRERLKKAPFQFIVDDWAAFFAAQHWAIQEIRYYSDEADKHHRPLRLPWWIRALMFITPKAKQQQLRRMAGFAVLTPQR